jgi:nitrite reductase/ring-hydroxylating ferredoxin subunit
VLVIHASANVVRAGSLADVFGGGDRAVLCVQREGTEAEELLVLRLRHGVFAVVNRCPHLGRSLQDARVHGHVLQCRGHSRSYNLRSGRPAGTLAMGGPPRLRRARAWIEDGQLYLDLTPLT